ncbi:MAG TPA: SH3 domain-containing protein [Geminicoccaceae bacterium]|nr:SH3 domain-containing protein [Geminicoccus sp.]HMU50743.1 SH3 domain-containing protein [Geminicoccaceae bacterium]
MKRSALAGLLGLFLLAAPDATNAQQAALQPGDTARVEAQPGSRVNMRSEPTTQRNNVTGRVGAGDQLTVRDAERQGAHVWYRVETATGETGWIRGDLLELAAREQAADGAPEPAAPSTPPPAAEPPAQATIPPADDWTRLVPPLVRQVDACINSLSMQPVTVTRVFQVEPDMVGVRLRDPTDRRWECLIGRNGNYPIRLDPLGDRVRPMPGDGNPVFVRAPAEATADSCSIVSPLVDPADGRVVGSRIYRTCPSTVDVPRP